MTETTLRAVPVGAERDAHLPLFSRADDSVDEVLNIDIAIDT
jgi:hypothetical protein